MQAVQSPHDIACIPIPKWHEAFPLEKMNKRLVHSIIDTIAGFHRAVGVRHVSAARIIFVIKPRCFGWPSESIYKSEFGEGIRCEGRGIPEELLDILRATEDIELVVENFYSHWINALKETPILCYSPKIWVAFYMLTLDSERKLSDSIHKQRVGFPTAGRSKGT